MTVNSVAPARASAAGGAIDQLAAAGSGADADAESSLFHTLLADAHHERAATDATARGTRTTTGPTAPDPADSAASDASRRRDPVDHRAIDSRDGSGDDHSAAKKQSAADHEALLGRARRARVEDARARDCGDRRRRGEHRFARWRRRRRDPTPHRGARSRPGGRGRHRHDRCRRRIRSCGRTRCRRRVVGHRHPRAVGRPARERKPDLARPRGSARALRSRARARRKRTRPPPTTPARGRQPGPRRTPRTESSGTGDPARTQPAPAPVTAAPVAPPSGPAAIAVEASANEATATVATTAPPPPAEQLVSVLSPLRTTPNGSYSLRLELKPVELGRVEMRVEMRDGVLHASIHADHESSAQLVRASLGELRDLLAAEGVRTGDLTVSDGALGWSGPDGRDANQTGGGRSSGPAPVAPDRRRYRADYRDPARHRFGSDVVARRARVTSFRSNE